MDFSTGRIYWRKEGLFQFQFKDENGEWEFGRFWISGTEEFAREQAKVLNMQFESEVVIQ